MPVGGPLYRQHAQRVHTGRPSTMQSCRRASLAIFAALAAAIRPLRWVLLEVGEVRPKRTAGRCHAAQGVQRRPPSPSRGVHLELAVQGQIQNMPIESLGGDLTNKPAVAAQGTANIVFLGQRLEGVDFVVADGDLFGALTKGSFQDFGPAADIYDVSVHAESRRRAGQRTGQLLRPQGRRAPRPSTASTPSASPGR